jgi:cobalt/nickel transport system permease protein
VSHLHIPDGVLPAWLWAPGLAIAVLALLASAWLAPRRTPQQVAYQGAIGALALAAMAVQIPLGLFDYHLTLAGPVGVLLGAAGAFQVMFVASAILAFVGHGGLTVIGLNALLLGAASTIARPIYAVAIRGGRSPGVAIAIATAVGQTISGGLWLAIVSVAIRSPMWSEPGEPGAQRVGLLTGIAVPMWLIGVAAESAVAFGIARFLGRVRPDLLPEAGRVSSIGVKSGE